MENKVTKEDIYKKGYLEDKKILLKPVVRGGGIIKEPTHMGYFMWEGASIYVSLPMNDRGDLVNIFRDDEERKFFEQKLSLDLSVHKKKDNFWRKFTVKITKDGELMYEGKRFNLADPMDNLRVRVLKQQEFIAPEWDKRYAKGHYKFVLVGEDHEEEQADVELDAMERVFTYFGSIKDSPKKMKDFLRAYLLETRSSKEVSDDSDKAWLRKEIKGIIDHDRETFLKLCDDDQLDLKQFIANGVKVGAIQKEGINKFVIPGETVKYSFPEMVGYVSKLKDETDDAYIKIDTQIKNNK